jgi:hypothetical protein
MSSNNIEFASLRSPSEMRSWLADNGCPDQLAALVIERRTQMAGFKAAQTPQPAMDADLREKVRAGGIF